MKICFFVVAKDHFTKEKGLIITDDDIVYDLQYSGVDLSLSGIAQVCMLQLFYNC